MSKIRICKFKLDIPYNDFFQYYGPDYTLHLTPSEMPNKNNSDYLEDIRYFLCIFPSNLIY